MNEDQLQYEGYVLRILEEIRERQQKLYDAIHKPGIGPNDLEFRVRALAALDELVEARGEAELAIRGMLHKKRDWEAPDGKA